MLLFNGLFGFNSRNFCDFNTSNVTIQPVGDASTTMNAMSFQYI